MIELNRVYISFFVCFAGLSDTRRAIEKIVLLVSERPEKSFLLTAAGLPAGLELAQRIKKINVQEITLWMR